MLVIFISSDILGITYKNKLHFKVTGAVSAIQIVAYISFNPKTLDQHVTLDKQGNNK